MLTVVSCSRQYEGLPQTTLTLEPPFPEIFTGETVTLRCGVEGGSAGWKYLWYKDSEDTPVLQTAGRSITGDSYTITAAAVSDQGQYCCRGQRGDQQLYSQLSDKVTVTVSEGHPQAVLTLQPAWAQIFTGETVTMSCEVEGGSAGWRFKQYRDGPEEAGCSDQYSSRYGDSCTISTAQYHHSGVYWCESASGQERSNAITLTVSNQWVILQTPLQPVIEGDTLTLRCFIRNGYKATRVIYYKDNNQLQYQAGTELSVDRVSKSDEGSYKCRAWWWNTTSRTEPWSVSAEVRVSVRELPKAVLTSSPQWGELYTGETVTLSCGVEGGFTGWQYLWYKSSQGGTVQMRGTTGARYTLSPVTQSHSGQYQCEAQRGDPPRSSQRSDPVTLTVSEGRPKPVLTREPAGEIFEGDTVTLSCVVEGGSGGWRYLWYKDRQGAPVYQTDSSSGTGAGYTISAAALYHSGEYWCGAGRGRNTSYSQYSDPIWVNVTALFSRVTLTASPGATVKEGEALNLTCEAAVNKTPRPELHYTIVRDGEPVTNSTDSALYSIASTEKSHTGSYTCAVESQGVKKSSQELHIEVQKSWSWIIAALTVSLVLIIFIPVTLLLFYRYKTKGFLFIAAKSRRPADQTPAQPSRGMELSGLGQEPGNSTASNLEAVYAEVKPNQQNKAKPRPKRDCDVLYSAVLVKKPEDNPSAADNSDVLYSELDMRNVKKKKKGKTLADNKPEVLYAEINQAKPSVKEEGRQG